MTRSPIIEYAAQTIWQVKNKISPGLNWKFARISHEPFVIRKITPMNEIIMPIHCSSFSRSRMNTADSIAVTAGPVAAISVQFVIVEYLSPVNCDTLFMAMPVRPINSNGIIQFLGGMNFFSCLKYIIRNKIRLINRYRRHVSEAGVQLAIRIFMHRGWMPQNMVASDNSKYV